MGCCSLILVLVVLMHHGTLKPNPLDELTVNLNLNDTPNENPIFGSPGTQSEEWKAGKITIIDPPSQERGRQTDKKRKRILGSSTYNPHVKNPAIPMWEHWTASLKIKKWEGTTFKGFGFCGGVLISEQHILTALHCIIMKKPIVFGTILNYNDVEIFFDPENADKWEGRKFTPIRFYYTNMNKPNRKAERLGKTDRAIKDDIALIKLNKKVTAPLRPIPRSDQDAVYTLSNKDGTNNFWFAGWGIWRLPPQPAIILRYTDKLIRMKRDGRNLCPKSPEYQNTNICFYSTTSSAACTGDSGSPGVVGFNDTSTSPSGQIVWRLQSIQSRGANCSQLPVNPSDRYSVHMDVYKYEMEIDNWLALP